MIIKLRYKMIGLLLCIVMAAVFIPRTNSPANLNILSDSGQAVALPVLMYHEIKYNKLGKDVITPYEFESDLKYLKGAGYQTITMSDLIAYVYDNTPLPEKPIILSFDDGYLNTYIFALPLLKKYQMKIVLSIVGKSTVDFTEYPDSNLDYSHVTWDQINELMQTGLVEIQNHTYNLHTATNQRYGCAKKKGETLSHYEEVLTEDIGGLQSLITEKTGSIPTTFAYPYGAVSKESVPILKKLGFKASLSCTYGINLISHDPEVLYGLRRICRSHGTNIKTLLTEAMKTLKYR